MKLSREELSLLHLALYDLGTKEIAENPHRLSDDAFRCIDDLCNRLVKEMKK